ncbi:MAG: hypothetical protein ACOZF2_16340 [Thermodesulfobacteriota bacterium]
MARNRYGWEKRAKEMARKQKNEEKMRRRQGKISPVSAEEETHPADTEAQTESEAKPG